MKKCFFKFLILLLGGMVSYESQAMPGTGPRRTTQFLAGGELKIRPLNVSPKTSPNTRDTIEIRLIYYRDCEANPGNTYTYPTPTDTMIGLIFSRSKCEYLTFATWFRPDLSDRYATPICPYNNFDTKCENPASPRIGYRTEVFTDTIELPVNADDWIIGMKYSNAIGQVPILPALTQTGPADWRMNWYTKKYGGNPAQRCAGEQVTQPGVNGYFIPAPRNLGPPQSPFIVRTTAINSPTAAQDAPSSYFYIEAEYSNAIPCGYFEEYVPRRPKYCANTTPHSASTPFVFICEGRKRLFDLGYYDVDGHTMSFEKSTPMKYACFGDPACGQELRTIDDANMFSGGYTQDNPLGAASTYNLDGTTGVLDITMIPPGAPKSGVGKYRAGIKITETDLSGAVVGKVYRDFMITVIADEECEADNSLAESSFFIPNSSHDFQNCAPVSGGQHLIEACEGTNIKFSVKAYSKSNLLNAALVITGELNTTILNSGGFITSKYINNLYPTNDTAVGTLHWNIPANTPPGIYPVIFQIRDCVNGYILSRSVVYKIRINKKNRIDWSYLGFTPKGTKSIFSLNRSSKRAYHCGSPLPLLVSAVQIESGASLIWKSIAGDCSAQGVVEDSSTDIDWTPGLGNKNSNYLIELKTDQYCNNRDTICVISKPSMNPDLVSTLPDSCYNTKGKLEVSGFTASEALTSLYDWQSLDADYDGTPSFLSNTADVRLLKKTSTYICYVISKDTCIYPVSASIDMNGIKPRGLFVTDKQYVCPGDTINTSKILLTTSICSPRLDFSKEKPGTSQLFAYPGAESNTDPTPKIFTATDNIDRGRTAFLYHGSELCQNGLKPGIIKELSFFIAGINDPVIYNNVKIWMRCTDRVDLQDGQFEDTLDMRMMLFDQSKTLAVGWNTFNIADFVWDGKTNLYFEVWTACNKNCSSPNATAPSYMENLTNYISVIGRYGNNTRSFDSSDTIMSNSRPNIRFLYSELQENISLDWNQDPSTLISKSGGPGNKEEDPKIVTPRPLTYRVKMTNGQCVDSTFVFAHVDTNYKITISPKIATKCPADTVHLFTLRRPIEPIPLVLNCGPIRPGALCITNSSDGKVGNKLQDSCRMRDSIFSPRLGIQTSTAGQGSAQQSVFGGSGIVGSPVTDKRIQLLYPYSELRNNPAMRSGYIRQIGFEIVETLGNTNRLMNFSIRMKCVPKEQDSILRTNFEPISSLEEVFFQQNVSTVFGWNRFELQNPYAWDGKSGLLIDICFDNFNGADYRSERVRATAQPRRRCLYQSARTTGTQPDEFGCNFLIGSLDLIRPNIEFTVCKPTRTPPPIPKSIVWAPSTFIGNTQVANPIIYNQFTTTYHTIVDYVDTTYGKSKVVCRVRDTMKSIVDRPYIAFDPPIALACEGQSVTVTAKVLGMNSNLYDFEWDTTQYGKVKADYTSSIQVITPPNPGYHYVKVRSKKNPNCFNIDSIWVDIQKQKPMPNLGAAALICPGDSVLLSIPTQLGYKNPRWKFKGQIIDTSYAFKVAEPGAYSVIVDSGACTNSSLEKWVIMRKMDSANLLTTSAAICEGDTAILRYYQSSNIANPLWNTGATTPIIKVNQAGIYYLIDPRDQYGCRIHMRDTAVVTVTANPDLKLEDDTLCMNRIRMITLQPIPFDPTATYTWYPDGRKLTSLNVYTPGVYKVTREKNGCKKEATSVVINDPEGKIVLGKNQAVCCDEIIMLDANPEGRKYKGYLWSTGERSQIISTKPNVSGLYTVEAIKPTGCKDTGSIFIDSKCGKVKAKAEKEIIYVGQENNIIGEHFKINATQISYRWSSTSDTMNQLKNKDRLSPIAIAKDTGDIEYLLVMTVIDTNYMPPKEPCIENEIVRFKTLHNQMDTVNIFTPDGDGINDDFYPRVQGVVEFKELKIYNRYGQLLHDDAKKPWDGKFNGEYQPVGVYVVFIAYELVEPKKNKQTKYDKLTVTLVR
jgi:gliding motility-associated-like protein